MPSLQDSPGKQSGFSAAAPGVFILGAQFFTFFLILNPWVLGRLIPELHSKYFEAKAWLWPLHLCGVLISVWLILRWREIGKRTVARTMFERFPIIGGVLLSLGTLLAVVALQEVAFKILGRAKAQRQVRPPHVDGSYDGSSLFCYAPLLGNRGVPCVVRRHQAHLQPADQPLFDVTYSLNENGFRVVPQADGEKFQHLAVFGCSFTFGEGVEDDESLPAQLASGHQDTRVYCFAMPGYGPGQPVLQIQSGATDLIEEPQGVAFYLYMDDHVKRITPNLRKVQWYTENYPAFVLDSAGNPQYLGSLSQVFAFHLSAYEALSCLNFSKWAGLDFPVFGEQEDIELSAALLAAARNAYEARFPGSRFYVLIDPVCHYRFGVRTLQDALRHRGVPYLDPKGLYGENPWGQLHFPVDGHPTPEAHAILAAWFWEQFPDGLLAGPRWRAE